MDVVVLASSSVLLLTASVVLVCSLAKRSQRLSDLCRDFSRLKNPSTKRMAEKAGIQAFGELKRLYALGSVAALAMAVMNYFSVSVHILDRDPAIAVLVVALCPPSTFYNMVCPLVLSTFYLASYFIKYFTAHIEEFAGRLQTDRTCFYVRVKKQEKSDEEEEVGMDFDCDSHLELGYSLCQLAKTMNLCLGPLLFVILAFVTSYCVVGLFAASNLFFGNLGPANLASCLGFLTITVLYGLLTFYACDTGQELENARREAKIQLERYMARNTEVMSGQDRFRAEILLGRFETMGRFRPSGYFSMNSATFLSVVSTMLTYLIVLVQFKVSNIASSNILVK